MHVAEQPAEIEACLAESGMRPIALLHREGILDSNFTGVHVIHVTEQEIRYLAETEARICACGTTERNLGDGISPAERWIAAGVDVCYGSDSNVQINLLEDARQLEYHLRLELLERAVLCQLPGQESLAGTTLFRNATQGWCGSLGAPGGNLKSTGRPADFSPWIE